MDRPRVRSLPNLFGLASLLGVAGCTDDDVCEGASFEPPPEPAPTGDDPPRVLGGQWLGSGVLELQFSGPLSSNGDLDPARFAIIGWDATTYVYGGYGGSPESCRLQTSYRELTAGYYYYYNPARSISAAWIGPEDDTLLRLRLQNPATQCRISTGSLATGVMLAYTDGDGPSASGSKLLTGGGVELGGIGPSWAISRLEGCLDSDYCFPIGYSSTGHLPMIDTLADIPCP